MIKTVLIVFFSILAIAGLCELIYTVRILIASPKGAYKNYIVIWLSEPYASAQLRFASAQRKWLGSGYAEHIIAITSGIDNDKAAEYFSVFKDGFIFCPVEALQNVLLSISGEYITNGRDDQHIHT